ncbi:MAG TPA: DUF1343 domain-containing protein [Bacillota bacterium]|nr:DUF1343 domain-containing protein [Bacillota bacterium]
MVSTGVDVILRDGKERKHLINKKLGLITNPTGVTGSLERTLDVLHRDFHLMALFSPEHGLHGEIQDALKIPEYRDDSTGLPVYSLYGDERKPTAEMLEGIDALIFDIQDIGVRFYSYITTMVFAMEACAEHGKEFIVLDRPNPIGGTVVSGNIIEEGFTSFLGLPGLTIQHGLTVGELAIWANETLKIRCNLIVVKMQGWNRDTWYDETGLPWVMPSPNMPTLDTATVFPGMCFIEGINVSEGRGTTRPFELIGAPWMQAKSLAGALNSEGLSGCVFRSCCFAPTFSKYAGLLCQGVQVHVKDREAFEPIATGIVILKTIKRLWPRQFCWVKTLERTSRGMLHIDILAGTDKLRKVIDKDGDTDSLMEQWRLESWRFQEERKDFLLY